MASTVEQIQNTVAIQSSLDSWIRVLDTGQMLSYRQSLSALPTTLACRGPFHPKQLGVNCTQDIVLVVYRVKRKDTDKRK
jgi:hypothetical protein